MEEWDTADESLDWLTGEYTYKRKRLTRALKALDNDDAYG
jgi:hypothetical protein